MNRSSMGVCVIINNRNFDFGDLEKREGTDIDASDLNQLFTKLGFVVRREDDKTTADMDDILKRGKAGFQSRGSLIYLGITINASKLCHESQMNELLILIPWTITFCCV